MRPLAIAFLLVACVSADAHRPEYSSSRAWVERQCATNATPQEERVFVGGGVESQTFASILHFHKGITLREVIDQTPLKGKVAYVLVLRAQARTAGEYITLGRSGKPRYEIKAQDMIWLSDSPPSGIEI